MSDFKENFGENKLHIFAQWIKQSNASIHLLILSLSSPSGPEILTDIRPVLLDQLVFICGFSVHGEYYAEIFTDVDLKVLVILVVVVVIGVAVLVVMAIVVTKL